MDFKTYLNSLNSDGRAKLAEACGTSVGQLNNVAYGYRNCAPILAAAIEQETKGAVTRQDLRPNDWDAIWPELAKKRKVA